MEKAKMMLSSILVENDKLEMTILIRYYINEYKSSNPIFLSQLFRLILKHIYENHNLRLLDVILDNFSQELGLYSYESYDELNNLLLYLIKENHLEFISKILQIVPRIGNQKTLSILGELISVLEKSKYTDSKMLYDLKKAYFDLNNNISLAKKGWNLLDIIESESIVRWKKFEEEVGE